MSTSNIVLGWFGLRLGDGWVDYGYRGQIHDCMVWQYEHMDVWRLVLGLICDVFFFLVEIVKQKKKLEYIAALRRFKALFCAVYM